MSYIDAFFDRSKDIIRVVERDENRKRVTVDYPAKYNFYYEDPKGKYKSIFGDSLSKVSCKNTKIFKHELKNHKDKKLFESDLNPTFSCLSDNYKNLDAPKLNVCFWDIETDIDPVRGYATTSDPFMPITAISMYLQWEDALITLAVPPNAHSIESATSLLKDIPNVFLFENDAELLKVFLDLIQNVDVLSAWNGSAYDLPFCINRIIKVLGKDYIKKFCLWDQEPVKREYEKYGKTNFTYDLIGRVHLDSLDLYKKFTYEERHSYSLDAISEYEIHEHKIPYDGSLYELYNNDFLKFIEYNRQDTTLLNKLDKKLKFIELANAIAHENTVLLPTTLGAVAVTDQAIINEAHELGLVVPNKKKLSKSDTQAAGAYVAYPKKGEHRSIGSIDINSLYPSLIRSLNMSPETIIGQIRLTNTENYIANQMKATVIDIDNDELIDLIDDLEDLTAEEIDAEIEKLSKENSLIQKLLKKHMKTKKKSFAAAWEGIFATFEYTSVINQEAGTLLTIDWENGTSEELSAAEIYNLIFTNKDLILSANGTIFSLKKHGIIPGLLSKWYFGRQEFQKKLKESIKQNNTNEIEYWDKRQHVKKISLNSAYGSLLNAGSRFFDKRLGQSTTLSGRQVVVHMSAEINYIITGKYDYTGDSILYNDTDSCYFTAEKTIIKEIEKNEIPWEREDIIQVYDKICEQVNNSFIPFTKRAFNCPAEYGEIIKASREIVASKGLFVKKKRYALLYYDKDGKRVDTYGAPGKIKAMGFDLKRSDTPVFIQKFLMEILTMVLTDIPKNDIISYIRNFRPQFRARPGWEKGTPKRVNNLTSYMEKEKKGKTNMPGHVRASINWNMLKKINNDVYSAPILDGSKIIVCKLKDNPLGFTSIAYPIDELRLPEWFKNLPFDHKTMEDVIIDKKLQNLIGVLNWNLSSTKGSNIFNNIFRISQKDENNN